MCSESHYRQQIFKTRKRTSKNNIGQGRPLNTLRHIVQHKNGRVYTGNKLTIRELKEIYNKLPMSCLLLHVRDNKRCAHD